MSLESSSYPPDAGLFLDDSSLQRKNKFDPALTTMLEYIERPLSFTNTCLVKDAIDNSVPFDTFLGLQCSTSGTRAAVLQAESGC